MSPTREIPVGKFSIGGSQPLFVIAGPCVIENEAHTRMIAQRLAEITAAAGLHFIFKASYDKANRTSISSYRGPGMKDGLAILQRIKQSLGVPVLTDIHAVEQAGPVAEICDVIQIPAFLCRQTDMLVAAGRTGARRQSQEGPVRLAVGNGQRGGKNREHGQRENRAHRARQLLRLPESRRGHALLQHLAAARVVPWCST